jgi:subtilisin family serine protease
MSEPSHVGRLFLRALAAVILVASGLATGGAPARVPSDPLAATWTYGAVTLPAAWDVTTGSEGVVIAIVDSGVDGSHPDLAGAVDSGYDFVDEDHEASDEPLPAGRLRAWFGRGATSTYRVREADRGRRLRLRVTATNSTGKATASSKPTATIR